jgi:Tfp pilus assembly protein FimT
MKQFLVTFLALLAGFFSLVVFASWIHNRRVRSDADRLIESSLRLAKSCRTASPRDLAEIRTQLYLAEDAIADAKGWNSYSPENEMEKASLHNRFVVAGCFKD